MQILNNYYSIYKSRANSGNVYSYGEGALMDVLSRICLLLSFCYVVIAKTPLNIQGFVPRDNPTFVATGLEPAAHLAVEDINNSSEYLANYTLNLSFVDTKVTNSLQ